jgi:hypothetical protein
MSPIANISDLRNPTIGVAYPHDAFAACGFYGVLIDGKPWIVAHRKDWKARLETPSDHGSLVVTDKNHAVYTTSHGEEIGLRRWRRAGEPPFAYCDVLRQ